MVVILSQTSNIGSFDISSIGTSITGAIYNTYNRYVPVINSIHSEDSTQRTASAICNRIDELTSTSGDMLFIGYINSTGRCFVIGYKYEYQTTRIFSGILTSASSPFELIYFQGLRGGTNLSNAFTIDKTALPSQ